MLENVGTHDAYARIGTGVLALVLANRRHQWGLATVLLAMFGSAKIAEGVTRFCPLNAVLGLTTLEGDGDITLWQFGPVEFRRVPRPGSVRTLWGVRQEVGKEGITAKAAVVTKLSGLN